MYSLSQSRCGDTVVKAWLWINILRPWDNILRPKTKYLVATNYYALSMRYQSHGHKLCNLSPQFNMLWNVILNTWPQVNIFWGEFIHFENLLKVTQGNGIQNVGMRHSKTKVSFNTIFSMLRILCPPWFNLIDFCGWLILKCNSCHGLSTLWPQYINSWPSLIKK